MDTSKAAAALGRRGGLAGRGESQRRGDSDHYRAIRAMRPKPQVYESRGEWAGYTVREGLKGWIVEHWSAVSGEQTDDRYLIPYAVEPRGQLDAPINEYLTLLAERIAMISRDGDNACRVRVLRKGHVVR